MKLTHQQQSVVDATRNNILVSAAAGSGKTMVLVERISSRIASGALDIRNTLVMTFTKAAASSMVDKMEKSLIKKMNKAEDPKVKRRIAEQISFLPLAQISTIHSFCTQVIREYGNELRDSNGSLLLEPGSSVLDGSMASILLSDAIDEVLDRLYAQCYEVQSEPEAFDGILARDVIFDQYSKDRFAIDVDLKESIHQWCKGFIDMCQCLGSGGKDDELKQLITKIYLNLRSLPDYESRMLQAVFDYKKEAEDFSLSPAAQYALDTLQKSVKNALPVAKELQSMIDQIIFVKDPVKNETYRQNIQAWLTCFFRLDEAVDAGLDWDYAHIMGKDVPDIIWPRKTGASDETAVFLEKMEMICESLYMLSGKLPQKTMKKRFDVQSQYFFFMTAEEYGKDLSKMSVFIFRFFEVIFLVDRQYALKKRSENSMDFSDQEQMALTLLKKEDIAEYYRAHFDEIYIDEYQDNSKIQDAIVACFSKNNVFFVGDVKQSIYRFRHARPDMFMARLNQYKKGLDGQLLELNGNFRSDCTIIDCVNQIFSEIMSLETGEVEYDQTHMLVPMKPDQRRDNVHLILIDVSECKNQDEKNQDKEIMEAESSEYIEEFKNTEKEGLFVAQKINEIIKGSEAVPGDFAVLARKNKDARQIAEMLNMMGIPAQSPEEEALFNHGELLLMQQMISLIDNFRQDMPLSAIMRAPFPQSNFSCEELLSIYLFAQENDFEGRFFFEKVLYFEENGPMPLRNKVSHFLAFIRDFKRMAVYLSVSELIEQIYLKTNYFEYLSARENGKERTYALEIFREWAHRFEKNKKGDLYAFVRFTQEIKNRQSGSDECELFAKMRNAVQCMSIHKSKGLEYKNVFVCGINSGIKGPASSDGALLFDDRNGVVCDCIFPEQSYKYTPINKTVVELKNKYAELAEQLRLLYVAATRAEEKLFFVGTIKRNADGTISGLEDVLNKVQQDLPRKLSPLVVRSAKTFLNMLLLVLLKRSHATLDLIRSETDPKIVKKQLAQLKAPNAPFILDVIDDADLIYAHFGQTTENKDFEEDNRQGEVVWPSEPTHSDQIEALLFLRLKKEYPYANFLHHPAKTTVSEIKRRMSLVDEDEAEHNLFESNIEKPINLQIKKEPIMAQQDKGDLSPAERGTLLHSVFQYLDFSAFSERVSSQDAIVQLERLVEHHMIRKENLLHMMPYIDSIVLFANSTLCKRMIAAEARPQQGPFREIPFSITEKVSQDDFCLIQGMIDCWFIEDGQAVLLDYKSDRIVGDQNEKERVLSERYSVQMDYYARAIEAAGGVRVKERWIWLIPDGLSFSF